MSQRGQSLYAKGPAGGGDGEGEEADKGGRLEQSGDKDSKYQQIMSIPVSQQTIVCKHPVCHPEH
jgi:hypothetical protein